MDEDIEQVLVTLTRLEDGALRLRFECVGTEGTWGVEELAALCYGDGDRIEDVRMVGR